VAGDEFANLVQEPVPLLLAGFDQGRDPIGSAGKGGALMGFDIGGVRSLKRLEGAQPLRRPSCGQRREGTGAARLGQPGLELRAQAARFAAGDVVAKVEVAALPV
jgi:hypothetical protein